MSNIWKGKLVQLRNPRAEDGELIAKLPHESEANAFAGGVVEFPEPPIEGVRHFFGSQAARNNEQIGNCKLTIETIAEKKWVGTVGLHGSKPRVRATELDIWVSPASERGKGYGAEAILIILNFAFNELNFQRVGLQVYLNNVAGVGLYKKLGFVEEGRLRRTFFYKGEYSDELVMSMLREEFLEKHQAFVDFLYSDH